jgi:hypothetical protein
MPPALSRLLAATTCLCVQVHTDVKRPSPVLAATPYLLYVPGVCIRTRQPSPVTAGCTSYRSGRVCMACVSM